MRRFGIGVVIAITAVVTAVITSLFWIAAYSIALPGGAPAPAGNVITETSEPGSRAELVLGPAGLAVPVAGIGVEELVDTFTQARADGARGHNAIDIMAPAGRPVVAAAEGTVEKLYFSEGGGGISVYVRSPDRQWVFYYAHLQNYAPGLREGQRIARGDVIGAVGSTGNANPEGPHLHFAVHHMAAGERWHEGTPVNPYPLLAGEGP
jgi:murein DD-endopeptidase MepM/ murein hydrolase activator NlpD